MPSLPPARLLTACLAVCGCRTTAPLDSRSKLHGGSLSTALAWLGIEDPPPPPPLDIDVLCDASAGSSCTAESLRATLDVPPAAAARPSSLVRLWVLGAGCRRHDADRHGYGGRKGAERQVRASPQGAACGGKPEHVDVRGNALLGPAHDAVADRRVPFQINMVHARIGASRLYIVITDATGVLALGTLNAAPLSLRQHDARLQRQPT